MRFNKELIKTTMIIILILVLVGIFLVPLTYNSVYSKGIADGQLSVIQTQMSTGEIFVIVNGTVKNCHISAFCSIENNIKNES